MLALKSLKYTLFKVLIAPGRQLLSRLRKRTRQHIAGPTAIAATLS